MPRIEVVDFFSGCGGTSAGLRSAGCRIIAGLDNDPESGETFRANFPDAAFFGRDIRKLQTSAFDTLLLPRNPKVVRLFTACAPCQPFSKHRRFDADDDRAPLLREFVRFARRFRPELVFVENVPGMQTRANTFGPFGAFVRSLRRLGYHLVYSTTDACSYGIPQRRTRLILIASLLGPIEFPEATHGPAVWAPFSTVRDWIGDLPPIQAGESHPEIPNHQSMRLSPLNLRRIRSTPRGGSRRDWPQSLWLACHSGGHNGHTDVYGRLSWDGIASALTTRCNSLSNGRFGHPDQDRAISIREAACLQTFPREFVFRGALASQARQIGNAVPVLLAQRFGENFVRHVSGHHKAAVKNRRNPARGKDTVGCEAV